MGNISWEVKAAGA